MAYTPPNTEPTQLRAGDTWAWTRSLPDYPASAWTLTYHFRNSTSYFDVVAAADGDDYAVSVATATTSGHAPGWYDWIAFVADADERYQVGSGRLEVLQDVAASVPYDGRSFARRMLDYIEAALENRASTDQLDLVNATMDARSIQRDRAGLLTLRSQFQNEVGREEQVRTGKYKTRILARFA
jgi:hypothetical protein